MIMCTIYFIDFWCLPTFIISPSEQTWGWGKDILVSPILWGRKEIMRAVDYLPPPPSVMFSAIFFLLIPPTPITPSFQAASDTQAY
jgi:hypothetical protein